MVKKLENEKEKDVIIDHRYYRNIIGNKGDNIKEIRDKFNQVQITIPGPGKQHLSVLMLLLCIILREHVYYILQDYQFFL
jgi:predicted PilT family ATPase